MWSQFTNVTDGRTDRQTTCDRNTALCTKVHHAVKTETKQPETALPVSGCFRLFCSSVILECATGLINSFAPLLSRESYTSHGQACYRSAGKYMFTRTLITMLYPNEIWWWIIIVANPSVAEVVKVDFSSQLSNSIVLCLPERQSAQMSKITNDGLTRYGTGCLKPHSNSGRQRVNVLNNVMGYCCFWTKIIICFSSSVKMYQVPAAWNAEIIWSWRRNLRRSVIAC